MSDYDSEELSMRLRPLGNTCRSLAGWISGKSELELMLMSANCEQLGWECCEKLEALVNGAKQ